MEPDVIRIYSSSPPPMEEGAEEEEDEFGDFGGFSGVPNSVSFTEFDTPTTFDQAQALNATSPPELLTNRGLVGGLSSLSSTNGTHGPADELSKLNGVVPVCQDGSFPERTVNNETKKALSNSLDLSGSGPVGSDPVDCNGRGTEVLTNGFATFDAEGSPSLQNSVHFHKKAVATEDTGDMPPGSPEDDFADFAAFSNNEGHVSKAATTSENSDNPDGESWLAEGACQEHSNIEQGIALEVDAWDGHRTGSITSGSDSLSLSADAQDSLSNGDGGCLTDVDSKQKDVAFEHEHAPSAVVCTGEALALNGVIEDGPEEPTVGVGAENGLPTEDGEGGQSDGKGSGNETETETETETSFGRPLSTDALEEYGDMSTTGSVPSPPLQEDTATPGDHSQLAEDDDEDFGDFGDVASFGGQDFADFDQPEAGQEQNTPPDSEPKQETAEEEDDDFGDFDTPKFHSDGMELEDGGDKFADFPVSDSFGNFSAAPVATDTEGDVGWNAFDEPDPGQGEGDSWAAFGEEQSVSVPLGEAEDEWQSSTAVMAPPAISDESSRRDSHSRREEYLERQLTVQNKCICRKADYGQYTMPELLAVSKYPKYRHHRAKALLSDRLERLFHVSFPEVPVAPVGEDVLPLKVLLEPQELSHPGQEEGRSSPHNGALQSSVWGQLQDIHEAFGLRHQWGGSHSNKTLLCSLGIDIRNILFTGQKKQPVIVPMYAASLGMLEPTKEPVKPISAAEMIASIAQAPPLAPEKSTCPPEDSPQEALPPVQFDWSSSGLTNPLDASGGSSLLNLDFFGPVEDSSCSSGTIPGVDPELFELTTAKMDPSGSTSRVADAFARLMSTMEKTSTSTRKPRKEENLSEEAAKVISGLPDLSFMQAKVLMFPTTLTPLGCSEPTPD